MGADAGRVARAQRDRPEHQRPRPRAEARVHQPHACARHRRLRSRDACRPVGAARQESGGGVQGVHAQELHHLDRPAGRAARDPDAGRHRQEHDRGAEEDRRGEPRAPLDPRGGALGHQAHDAARPRHSLRVAHLRRGCRHAHDRAARQEQARERGAVHRGRERHGEAAPGGDERAGHAPHPPRLWRREAQLQLAAAHGDHAPRFGTALGTQPAVVRDAPCHAARRPDHELQRQHRVARGQDAWHLRHADHHGRQPARPHHLGPAATHQRQAVRQGDEGPRQEYPHVQRRGRGRLHRPDAQGGGRRSDAEDQHDAQVCHLRRRDPADDPGAKAGQRQAQGGGQVLQGHEAAL